MSNTRIRIGKVARMRQALADGTYERAELQQARLHVAVCAAVGGELQQDGATDTTAVQNLIDAALREAVQS